MRFHAWLICLLLIVACTKDHAAGGQAAITMKDIAYGNDPKQKMDLYLPVNRSSDTTKLLVLIHGGGWATGDKADFTGMVPLFQQRLPGYAICNINYRLAANGTNLFPAQENDVKAAIEFLFAKRSEYRISDQFVYVGASAGGHLALLQAYKQASPVKAKAVISFFGPTDLTNLYQTNALAAPILLQATGTSPDINPAVYQQSSPVGFVNAGTPPTLLLHGGADPLVPPAQAQSLQSLLASAGVPNQYILYPNEGHGWTGANLDDSMNKIVAFLQAHVP